MIEENIYPDALVVSEFNRKIEDWCENLREKSHLLKESVLLFEVDTLGSFMKSPRVTDVDVKVNNNAVTVTYTVKTTGPKVKKKPKIPFYHNGRRF